MNTARARSGCCWWCSGGGGVVHHWSDESLCKILANSHHWNRITSAAARAAARPGTEVFGTKDRYNRQQGFLIHRRTPPPNRNERNTAKQYKLMVVAYPRLLVLDCNRKAGVLPADDSQKKGTHMPPASAFSLATPRAPARGPTAAHGFLEAPGGVP